MEISGSSETCNADNSSAKSCTSSCGHIHNISHPFRLNDDPKYCGDVRYTLYCESNITVTYLLSESTMSRQSTTLPKQFDS
ncbi:hypothetical protein PS1_028443 [Malus domestica]